MDLKLQGKRVLITGSSRGIGLAAARLFLQEGASVIVHGVNEARLQETVAGLCEQGTPCCGIAADVSKRDQVKRLFEEVQREFGGIDVLVNNAGIYPHRSPLQETTDEEWDQIMNTNLKSVLMCSQAAVSFMKQQDRGGVILHASSFGAIVPSAGAGLYAAAKAAIINLTRTMSAEYAPWNIRVNAYVPGVVETDMTAQVRQTHQEALVSQIALKRIAKAEEIAAPVVFLASSQASYITGAVLEVSGGKLAVQNGSDAWSES